ncbi:chloride channel protein [Pinibacter aurantiacus]|uniref:Chloride channel protein n=1 Tax=Pinibacter aurantiacus TaxID=2851599 RepID=A0A9E2SA82_9BACT|nr:chloride channel protein [Pinibacter aurantiacus]MBV4358811.1 chloride channel protein [Pinibacter aurantiacus]
MKQRVKALYDLPFNYLRNKVNRIQYIMIVASLVGLFSGLVAVLLKICVHFIEEKVSEIPFSKFSYLVFPGVGLLITVVIVQKFYGGHVEKGIAMVLQNIARRSSFIPIKHTYIHVITSSVTVGLGGSVGLEAPIVATGSAVGSNMARIHGLNYQERTLLLACGAAAGISAVFNAPIAGVIFSIEVLLSETLLSYFIPLIISAVIGALCSKIILKEEVLFNFVLKENFNYNNIVFYILLGVLCGFISLYYAHVFKKVEHRIHDWKLNIYFKAMIGGLLLLVIYILFPTLFGEGYDSVKLVANGSNRILRDNTGLFSLIRNDWAIIIFVGAVMLLKPIAAGVTIGSGGNGGNFAPSLFVGAYLGYFFSKLLNTTKWFDIPTGNFSLVGMAGVLSGVMYCPLTAIFLIAEITNGYELIIPLMLVSSISFFIVKHFQPYSMETKKLAMEGQIFTHKKEQNILTAIQLDNIVKSNYQTISIDSSLGDVVDLVKRSEKNIFAVIDQEEKFIGVLELNDVKKEIFSPELFDTMSVRQLVKRPADIVYSDETMSKVMQKFDETHSWYLPVLSKEGTFRGFISKSKIFEKYRQIIADQHDLYEN